MKRSTKEKNSSNKRSKKRSKKEVRTYIIITVIWIVIIAFASVVLFVAFSSGSDDATPEDKLATEVTTSKSATPDTAEASTGTNQAQTKDSEDSSQPTTTGTAAENSDKFEAAIEKGGLTAENLNFEQLVVVDSSSTSAEVICFEKKNGGWSEVSGLESINGFVGSQGVSDNASESASYTPKGLFSVGTGFGIMDDPGTGLDYFKVTQNSYWVDDSDSKYYNQHVEGTSDKDWDSAEHLISCSPSYNYCFFIEYNTNPVVPGKGSAFFMHVGSSPTAGCVAVPQQDMINILRWLDKGNKPHILIM